jgi:hypothetical protein
MIALLLDLASRRETAGKPKDQVHPGVQQIEQEA